ncbi:MAG TPA: hypothetical protein VI895_04615 [Bdellovibrionota bacterium]|nr:hypothetical protein [Bdellovibrionota bacterium]
MALRKFALHVLLLLIVGSALYYPTLRAPFVYDDYLHFVENERILHPQNVGDIFKNGLQETRPIYNLSLAVQARWFGTDPTMAHAGNVVLQLLAAVLLYLFLLRMTGSAIVAFIAAAIFEIHPLAVESVAYFNSRSGLLSLLFSLCAFLCFEKRGRIIFFTGLFSLVAAMGSKEDAIGSVALALLFDRWRQAHGGIGWSRLRQVAVLATAITVPFLYLVFRSPHIGTVGEIVEPWWRYLWQQGTHVPLHLSLFLWPWPLTPDRDLSPWMLSLLAVSTGWILLFGLLAILWSFRRSRVALGVVWAIAALIPTHTVVPMLDLQATRLLYPAIPGLSLAFASVLSAFTERRAWVGWSAATLLFLFFGWRSSQQIYLWAHPLELWQADTREAPSRWRAWLDLTIELAERKRWAEADEAISRAEALNPKNASVLYNSAAIAATRTDGKKDKALAVERLKTALEVDPHHRRSERLLRQLTAEP